MEYVLIISVTLIGAGLTLFSGFGLGTLLTPVFALFFPIEVAIGMTAIVHFANNLFKLSLFFKNINLRVLLIFGIPSLISSLIGAFLLTKISTVEPLLIYSIQNTVFHVTSLKLIIALLLAAFSIAELSPKINAYAFDKRYLPLGGLLSGFFGGFSGNQGALRSAFLLKLNLPKDAFIATGVSIACVVDISRLTVYSHSIFNHVDSRSATFVSIAIVSAFTGVLIGNRILKKITIRVLQIVVSALLLLFALLLGSGII